MKGRGEARVVAFVGSSGDARAVGAVARAAGLPCAVSAQVDEELASEAAVVIFDRDLAVSDWREDLERLAGKNKRACLILLSKVADEYLFDEVVRRGGFDVATKPVREDELGRLVKLAVNFWKGRRISG